MYLVELRLCHDLSNCFINMIQRKTIVLFCSEKTLGAKVVFLLKVFLIDVCEKLVA